MKRYFLNPLPAILGLFLASRALFICIFEWATNHFLLIPEKRLHWHFTGSHILNHFGSWDTGWYLRLANEGYINTPLDQGQSNYGFFPLYPMLMRIFGFPFHDNFIGGVIASNLLLLAAAFFLYHLCLIVYANKKTALLSVAILFFFPASYLFSGVFSEAPYLCFSVMSVYFFEKENYFFSGVSGFFLSLTRPFGVLLLVPLLFRHIQKHGLYFRVKTIFLLLIPLGMIVFFLFCYFTTGDFLMYVHAKQAGWYTRIKNPLFILYSGLIHPDNVFILINSLFTLLIIGFALYYGRYVRGYLLLWTLLLIAAPLTNGYVNLVCMPRYIAVCFPLFMQLAAFTAIDKRGWGWIFLLAVINFILCAFYSLGYQFAA